jgi:N-methylhydantoinase A/oxoprolinase/acetone carboxylase beta subunit
MAWIVTIDNGSTFTDGCLFADGRLSAVKVLTTPYDLMRCFVDVFRSLAKAAGLADEVELLRRVEEVRYSTTSGTNALLVRKGTRVGVIVGREGVADLYGLRRWSSELVQALVGDRVAAFEPGEASAAEVDARILQAIRGLLGRGAQWIVVSLPEPWGARAELDFKNRHMKLLPGHLLGSVPVLFSRDLCADPDDTRRTATAILNGFLHRETARFLYHAEGWLRDRHVAQPLRIMRNDGACGRVAKTTAVKTLDSGPMGGLSGAGALARLGGERKLVTVDVGGTSADIGVLEDGKPIVDLFGSVHGLPLSFPFPQLRTAALGGGSLFRVEGGKIRIGPESAGALPGPASFGRGGADPTLTDAALVAGYLDPAQFAGGAITLRRELAEQAIVEKVARPLGLEGAEAGALAMIDAFANRLAADIRLVIERRKWKPEAVVLAIFGGSGPMVACLVAARIGLRKLVVPAASASFSALGVGFAELAHEYRALFSTPVSSDGWKIGVERLRDRAERDMFGEGVAVSACRGSIRVRSEEGGREYEVGDLLRAPDGLAVKDGRIAVDYQLALTGSGGTGFPRGERRQAAAVTERPVLIDGKAEAVRVVDAGAFETGAAGAGPCVLESPFWSAPVPSGWSYAETDLGLRLTR